MGSVLLACSFFLKSSAVPCSFRASSNQASTVEFNDFFAAIAAGDTSIRFCWASPQQTRKRKTHIGSPLPCRRQSRSTSRKQDPWRRQCLQLALAWFRRSKTNRLHIHAGSWRLHHYKEICRTDRSRHREFCNTGRRTFPRGLHFHYSFYYNR